METLRRRRWGGETMLSVVSPHATRDAMRRGSRSVTMETLRRRRWEGDDEAEIKKRYEGDAEI
jgi:hypothetical protein